MNDELRAALAAPMEPEWRLKSVTNKATKPYPPGTKGQFLAYIDARDVFDRLDATVGVGRWQTSVKAVNPDGSVIVALSVAVPTYATDHPLYDPFSVNWITQEDIGYSNNPGAAHEEEPLKAAVSDGIKRAAVHFGIGRFLYEMEPRWLPIDPHGKPLAALSNDSPSVARKQMLDRAADELGAIGREAGGDGYPREMVMDAVAQAVNAPRPQTAQGAPKWPATDKQLGMLTGLARRKHGAEAEGMIPGWPAIEKRKASELIDAWMALPDHNARQDGDVGSGRTIPPDPQSYDLDDNQDDPESNLDVMDWTRFYAKWRPLGVSNLQDIERRIGSKPLPDMTPGDLDRLLSETGA